MDQKADLKINLIKLKITKKTAQEDYDFLVSILGEVKLKQLFSAMVLNLDHSGVRSIIAPLAMIYRVAEQFKIADKLTEELQQMESIASGGKYAELMERYLSLQISRKEFPNIETALPEYKVIGESNPDWTFRTKEGKEFYVEVTAISMQKTIDDINSFSGRIPTSKIISSYQEPLYFEVIFAKNPRQYDPKAISDNILNLVRTEKLPTTKKEADIEIFVDILSRRYQQPQIPRMELNNSNFLKSIRMMGGKLAYTLATKISLKTIEDKINEKKQSNGLKIIGNAWIFIFTSHTDLKTILDDYSFTTNLTNRIRESKWLSGVIIIDLYNDTEGNWELRYLKID